MPPRPLDRLIGPIRRSAATLRPPALLSEQIDRLRWQVPLLALLLVVIQQTIEHWWLPVRDEHQMLIEIALYGLVGPAIMWLALGWTEKKVAVKEAAEAELVRAHAELTQLNRRVSFLLKVNQRLGQAADETALASLAMQLPGEIVPQIVACAMVRFDEHHQPMPVEYRGELDETALAAWHQHLSSQTVRLTCQTCQLRGAQAGSACVLFQQLPLAGANRVVCLPLERNGRQFAMLGLFLARGQTLTEADRDLLEAVAAEIALAFENTRLRTHELAALYEINETLHQRLDFDGLMARILNRTLEASHADAGLLLIQDTGGALTLCAAAGEWAASRPLPLVENLAAGAVRETNGEPVLASLQTPDRNTASLLFAPMIADQDAVGVIVLGSQRGDAFHRQQTRLVSAIAGQAALLAENTRLYARLEHQAILAERGRLAREMHDGLAQTLGYIKMRAGQIAQWIERGQVERADDALRELSQTANDAYLDLRATIDGLRLPLSLDTGAAFAEQLRRLADAFEHQTGIAVGISAEGEPPLSAAAQAHLLRIVQESLTNVRKHASANQVRIGVTTSGECVRLIVQDDGLGFDTGSDMPENRHGLRLMRERAELLGADLQVTSAPGRGTSVSLELPLTEGIAE